jgi:hypothetical protein
MALHDPFGFLKHKLWPKEGPRVKLAVWLPTTKSWESPWFPCVQVACHIPLKTSWRGLQLCFRTHLDWRFAHKIMGLQSCGSSNVKNFGILIWESWDKKHLGASPMARHKKYYKGEGGGSSKSRPWWVVSSCLLVARPCTKSVLAMH